MYISKTDVYIRLIVGTVVILFWIFYYLNYKYKNSKRYQRKMKAEMCRSAQSICNHNCKSCAWNTEEIE